jgi:hypothetical protein
MYVLNLSTIIYLFVFSRSPPLYFLFVKEKQKVGGIWRFPLLLYVKYLTEKLKTINKILHSHIIFIVFR